MTPAATSIGIAAPILDTTGMIIEAVYLATGVILARQAVDRHIEASISAFTSSPRELPRSYVRTFTVDAISLDLVAMLKSTTGQGEHPAAPVQPR